MSLSLERAQALDTCDFNGQERCPLGGFVSETVGFLRSSRRGCWAITRLAAIDPRARQRAEIRENGRKLAISGLWRGSARRQATGPRDRAHSVRDELVEVHQVDRIPHQKNFGLVEGSVASVVRVHRVARTRVEHLVEPVDAIAATGALDRLEFKRNEIVRFDERLAFDAEVAKGVGFAGTEDHAGREIEELGAVVESQKLLAPVTRTQDLRSTSSVRRPGDSRASGVPFASG